MSGTMTETRYISSTIAALLCIIILTVISPTSLALSFYPEKTSLSLNETINVKIEHDSSCNDVKIFIEKDGKTISEIFSSGWKNAYFYLPEAYPRETSFRIRPTLEAPLASLCVRLRKCNEKSSIIQCKNITISSLQSLSVTADSIHNVNSPLILNSEPLEVETSLGKFRSFLVYSLIIFAAFILFLVFFRKL